MNNFPISFKLLLYFGESPPFPPREKKRPCMLERAHGRLRLRLYPARAHVRSRRPFCCRIAVTTRQGFIAPVICICRRNKKPHPAMLEYGRLRHLLPLPAASTFAAIITATGSGFIASVCKQYSVVPTLLISQLHPLAQGVWARTFRGEQIGASQAGTKIPSLLVRNMTKVPLS